MIKTLPSHTVEELQGKDEIIYSQQLGFRQGAGEADERVYTEYMTEVDGVSNAGKNSSAKSIDALEEGKVIYFPSLPFHILPAEASLLTSDLTPTKKSKNISYDPNHRKLKSFHQEETHPQYLNLQNMLHRYSEFAQQLIARLFPLYPSHLTLGRTTFRPVEIAGRKSPSYRKDDTRLHVDAFPSKPTQGRRLLRVFSNINPDGKPRVWRLGENFETVANHFKSSLHLPPAFYKHVLKALKITKSLRTDYDTLMLSLHNQMKADLNYQKTAQQEVVPLAAGSTWIVYTDIVSHAAMAGQFCCEQTFTLPVEAMKSPSKSPVRILERLFDRTLI